MNNNFFIINAFGRSNRGDAVLLDECISEILGFNKNATISAALFEGFSVDKEDNIRYTERLGNTRAGILGRIFAVFELFIAIFSALTGFHIFTKLLSYDQENTYKGIKESDVLISAPGGYIHDTNFAYLIAIIHIWIGVIFKKKVILAPQSIGPLDGWFSKKIARFVLSKVDYICARESYTKNFLIKELNLSPSIVIECGDSAFWNSDVEKNSIFICDQLSKLGINNLNENKIFGITVVDWSFPKSDNPDLSREKYACKIAEIIDTLVDRYSLTPVIFNQVNEDIPMAELVAARAKSKVIIDKNSRDPEILRAMISNSYIFLGTRFHSCIFALIESLPVIAISYLPKTSYILKDLDLEHNAYAIDDFNSSDVIAGLDNFISDINFSREESKNAVKNYRASKKRLTDVLLMLN